MLMILLRCSLFSSMHKLSVLFSCSFFIFLLVRPFQIINPIESTKVICGNAKTKPKQVSFIQFKAKSNQVRASLMRTVSIFNILNKQHKSAGVRYGMVWEGGIYCVHHTLNDLIEWIRLKFTVNADACVRFYSIPLNKIMLLFLIWNW